jgi:hypothetical protein
MAHRSIVTVATGLMVCFMLLTRYDREFFLLHFYQSLIYILIVLMLFYFHERWAYMLGMVAPAGWLLLSYSTGMLGGAMRQVGRLLVIERPSSAVSMIGAVIAALDVLLIVICAYRWKREYSGLHKGWGTFLGSLGIVVVYYAILVCWFLQTLSQQSRQFRGGS